MRRHSLDEARAVVDLISRWRGRFTEALGRPLVHAADEYYLLAGYPFPETASYEGFAQEENGVGMARAFRDSFFGQHHETTEHRGGFFASVDGAPAAGYRARRSPAGRMSSQSSASRTTILTGVYGAQVLAPILSEAGYDEVQLVAIENTYFGGNIAVTGLLTGADIARVLAELPLEGRYLLPDVCLSEGRFLDGTSVADLPRTVEIVETSGQSLRAALDAPSAGHVRLLVASSGAS
jgi:NifB/MoaA-like Fe-S oxidoreductase